VIPNDLLVAKILLALSGKSDDYTEALLGGALMALRIQGELLNGGSEVQSGVDQAGVGAMQGRSGEVQPDDPEASQALDEAGVDSGELSEVPSYTL
jgi:hypothetical protein